MKISTWYGLALFVASLSFASQVWSQTTSSAMEGVIRMKVTPELVAAGQDLKTTTTSQGVVLTGVPSLDKLCQQYATTSIKRVFPYNAQHEAQHQAHGLHLWYELKFKAAEDAKKVASAYASLATVSHAEPMLKTKQITGTFTAVERNAAATSAVLPFNDPYLPKQWHYNNNGDYDGLPGADINLFQAWKTTTGTPNVVVSVHDQGVDYTHEDLAANMWKNMTEFNGQPNVDDDNNGYVDDIYGYNFSDNTGAITKMEHGTHVSGTIAAVNNNGKGVSGIAGGSGKGDGVRIMSCQILGGQGSNNPESYVYAADNGALISQNSWGYIYAGDYEQATLDAIDYFIAEAGKFAGSPMKGGVVFFAAGNNGADETNYPGYYPSVVAVSSLGPKSVRAYYSNYGAWVDISSYGGDDTMHAQNQVLSTVPNNGYAYMQGTSMATPHVSGIAALILSKHGGPGFTNKMLLNHLLTGVRDVYPFNPDMTGLLGAGISDAALAVASDSKLAPQKITDLSLTGISQDFATLQWSVPSDPDDGTPTQFNIFYNTDSITPANLASAGILSVRNSSTAGISIPFEIDGLQSTTRYYFMVQSIDRWGNISSFSNEVKGTTNEGPSIVLNKSELDLTVDILADSVTTDSIKVFNKGAGVLKWSTVFRHKNVTLPFKNPNLHYPTIQTQSAAPGLTLTKHRAPIRIAATPIDGNDFTTVQKEYYDPYSDIYVVGDEDLTLTNSSATKFTVTEPNGFNFTQIISALAHDNNTGPMILEVYIGENLKTATLTYAQEVWSDMTDPYWYYINLNEEIFLENGTTFWVVFHVPARNKYPLGIGFALNSNDSENCLYSTNLGKSWTKLSSAISDNRWVWVVAAISERATIGNYIRFSPESGQLVAGDSSRVNVHANGITLKNGIYNAETVITSNDKENPLVKLPVNLEVKNQAPLLKVADIVDFNSVFVGVSKTVDVTVSNYGYGDFSSFSVAISSPQFTLVGTPPDKFAARYTDNLTFKFKPTIAGSANATVTLTDGSGNKKVFYLNGVGTLPPVIALAPAAFTFTNLTLGNTFTATVNIQNKGKYPLKYAFPKFADASALSEIGTDIQKFGYAYKANLGGASATPAYSFTDISLTEPNVIDHLVKNDFYEVDLGFAFPFYGNYFSKIYVTKSGAITFANDGYVQRNSGRIGDPSAPSGYITASWYYYDPRAGGGIHFKRLPGKTIIEYKNVALNDPYYGQMPSTFQIILYKTGDVEIVYEDMSAWDPFSLSYLLVGMDDPQHNDGFKISDVNNPIGITSNSIIHIYNPGVGAIQSVSSANGIVQAGGAQSVDLTFSTANLYQGNFIESVNVVSNDPIHNPVFAKVNFSITAGGTPNLTADESPINFGKVFMTDSKKSLIVIKNEGTANAQITAMTFQGNAYTLDKVAPITMGGTQSSFVNIILNTANLGVFTDTLKITSNAGNVFKIPLYAEVVPQPIISVDVASIDKTLNSGDSTNVVVNVSNTGDGDLAVTTRGTDWLYSADPKSGVNNTYSWITSRENGGPTYNWIDIVQPENELDSIDVFTDNHFWQGVKLPFSFSFYGKKYDSLYVGANGAVTFKGGQGNHLWVDQDIPMAGGLDNYIAPLWLSATADTYFFPDAGIYYKAFADKVVISYYKFNVWGMGNSISFQAILFANNNIQFQYDLGSTDNSSFWGMAGLENTDGSAGIFIAKEENFLKDKMAIFLAPASSQIIPAQSSRPMTVTVDASNLYAGNYTGNLVIQNNSPANPALAVPGTLQVFGQPGLSCPDAIAFGETMAYQVEDNYGVMSEKVYYQYVDLTNSGRDVTIINALQLKNASPELLLEVEITDHDYGFSYWTDMNAVAPLNVLPTGKIRLRVSLTPSANKYEIVDSLLVSSNISSGDFSVPITASIVLPPVLGLSTDQLTVQANTKGYSETKEFIIDNKDGGSSLTYSLSLVYNRAGSTNKTAVQGKANRASSSRQASANNATLEAATPAKTAVGSNFRDAQVESFSQYNRVLQYDTLATASIHLGFNGSSQMLSGISFTAPATGFNLSTVITWYVPGEWLNSDLIVEIRGGNDDIRQSQVIYTQSFNYTITTPDNTGKFIEIPLDEPQLFYPGEKFFIVITYPLDTTHPQGTSVLNQNLANTFFFSTGDGNWFDLTTGGFPSHGWTIKAAEKEAAPSGWATLDNTTGTIAAGMQQSVSVLFNSAFAMNADNYAHVNITSNDPINTGKSELLLLHKNQAPVFTDGNTLLMSVIENDTLNYTLSATDPEGDSLTFSLSSPYPHVSLKSNGDSRMLSLTTDYDMAGNYEYEVMATDAYGNASIQKLLVTVVNVNRAPVLTSPLTERNYFKGDGEERIHLDQFFQDPDGDEMTFVSLSSNEAAVNVFSSGSQIILSPERVGDGVVTIAATDAFGATDTVKFDVHVSAVTAIEPLQPAFNVVVFPNPTRGKMVIHFAGDPASDYSVSLTSVVGVTIMRVANISQQQHDVTFDLEGIANGIYIIEVADRSGRIVKRIVKE